MSWETGGAETPPTDNAPKKPTKGKCRDCNSQIEFLDDGSGICTNCGRTIWWDKSRQPSEAAEAQAPAQPYAPPPYDPNAPQPPQQPYGPPPGGQYPPGQYPLGQYPPGQYGQYGYPGYAPYPPPEPEPQTINELDPATRKTWKKMQKKFKGGLGPGIAGGIVAGVLYVAMPLIILMLLSYLIPADASMDDFPSEIQLRLAKLWVLPIMLGWIIIMTGFARKYYRRGSFQRAVAGASFQGAKGLYLYALLTPFAFILDLGENGGAEIDLLGYFKIVYLLLALRAVYDIFEYFALRNDLQAFYEGEIPVDYYPRKLREQKKREKELEDDYGGSEQTQPPYDPYTQQQYQGQQYYGSDEDEHTLHGAGEIEEPAQDFSDAGDDGE